MGLVIFPHRYILDRYGLHILQRYFLPAYDGCDRLSVKVGRAILRCFVICQLRRRPKGMVSWGRANSVMGVDIYIVESREEVRIE